MGYEITIQIVFARGVTSSADQFLVELIEHSTGFIRSMRGSTVSKLWTIAGIERNADSSGTRHVVRG